MGTMTAFLRARTRKNQPVHKRIYFSGRANVERPVVTPPNCFSLQALAVMPALLLTLTLTMTVTTMATTTGTRICPAASPPARHRPWPLVLPSCWGGPSNNNKFMLAVYHGHDHGDEDVDFFGSIASSSASALAFGAPFLLGWAQQQQ